MRKSPADMVKPQRRRTEAFSEFEKPDNEQEDTGSEKVAEKPVQAVSAKLKTRAQDYEGKVFKKTSVDLPEELLHEWSMYCVANKVSKRAHLIEILAKELNKKR